MMEKVSSQQDFSIHADARIAYVSLNVSDLDASLDFYKSILGFKTVGKISDKASLSVDGNPSHLIELKEVEGDEQPTPIQRRAGLYHSAILLPERKYLADMLQNLYKKRDLVYFDGMADHLVSEAIYIKDPDFNGVEIYRDRPASEWTWNGTQVKMTTKGLDTENLLRESTASGWKEMPVKTVIGHIHLHVRNLAKAMQFYSKTLGLNHNASYPGAYFFAAGKYHHHIAANTWLGTEIRPASPEKVGLNHFAIELPSIQEFERTVNHLSNEQNLNTVESSLSESVFIHDIEGIRIRLQHK